MSDSPSKALFEKIFEANREKIYRFAFKLTDDAARAQEITQQCFIRLWENMDQVQEGQDVFPLLFVYVKHLVIDESRKMYRDKQTRSRLADHQKNDPGHESPDESRFYYKEFRSHLQQVVERMPEQRKHVYVLSRDHGYSHKEIAARLSISPATVKNHLNIALQYIRRELLTFYGMDVK